MTNNRIRAEQALLGAVLTDPAAHHQVLDLVEAGDFERPWHAQVLAAMQRLRSRQVLPVALAVYQEIQNDPDLPHVVAQDGTRLTDLMEASPRPANVGAYAAMVIESSIRQQLQLAGERLGAAAQSGDLEIARLQSRRAGQVVQACRSRWDALPGELRRQLPGVGRRLPVQHDNLVAVDGRRMLTRGGRLAAGPLSVGLAAHAPVPAHAGPPRVTAAQRDRARGSDSQHADQAVPVLVAGLRALRDLAAAPGQIASVRGWLQPEHFADPRHGELYAIMRDLRAQGQPVDPLTITWEAQRRGISGEPGSLTGGTGVLAFASAREVYRLGELARIERAGRAIQADAADHAQVPPVLLTSAAHRIRDLEPKLDADRRMLPALTDDEQVAHRKAGRAAEPGREAAG